MQSQTHYKKRFSFEFFPPKTDQGAEKLRETTRVLAALKPEFFSVTYGAGGSTRDRTLGTVLDIKANAGVEAAPHLSCVGDSKEEVRQLLETYKNNGISRIVALRGDLPSGMGAALNELAYASDLVAYIRQTTGEHFDLEVAAYPEMHPQAANARQDLLNFKKKVDAGANSAITQFFFNIDAYFYFVEACEKEGISIPIVPGIMPIINFANLQRFAGNCGAEIPRWLAKKMETYSDQKSQFEFGIEFITHFCEELLAQGAPGLHFYTMNQVEPNKTIWENLGLSK